MLLGIIAIVAAILFPKQFKAILSLGFVMFALVFLF